MLRERLHQASIPKVAIGPIPTDGEAKLCGRYVIDTELASGENAQPQTRGIARGSRVFHAIEPAIVHSTISAALRACSA